MTTTELNPAFVRIGETLTANVGELRSIVGNMNRIGIKLDLVTYGIEPRPGNRPGRRIVIRGYHLSGGPGWKHPSMPAPSFMITLDDESVDWRVPTAMKLTGLFFYLSRLAKNRLGRKYWDPGSQMNWSARFKASVPLDMQRYNEVFEPLR